MLSETSSDDMDAALLLDADVESQLERSWKRQRHYGFCVGGLHLLLRQGLYSELLLYPGIAPLPNSPSHFCGLTNVRGNLVPVYRLESWRGLQQSREPPQWVVVVDQPQRGAALVVDGKPQALDVATMVELDEVPDSIAAPLRLTVEKAYLHSNDYWYLINHEALFSHLAA